MYHTEAPVNNMGTGVDALEAGGHGNDLGAVGVERHVAKTHADPGSSGWEQSNYRQGQGGQRDEPSDAEGNPVSACRPGPSLGLK